MLQILLFHIYTFTTKLIDVKGTIINPNPDLDFQSNMTE